jgi:hypothetical protein
MCEIYFSPITFLTRFDESTSKHISWNIDRGFNSRAVNGELIPQILKKETYSQNKLEKNLILCWRWIASQHASQQP